MTPINSLFAANEILLTGGNGFVGKVVLALLLDRYPEVKKVHVLLRAGRGVRAGERLQSEILESPVFRDLLAQRGAGFFQEKIQVCESDLGRPATVPDISSELGLIIHCAGLVDFVPPVDKSLAANVTAVENVIALAKNAGAKLLHVSTCYVAGEADGLIEETEPVSGFYPLRQGPHDLRFDHSREIEECRARVAQIRGAGAAGEKEESREAGDTARRLTDLGLRRAQQWGWVNTYTYTKSLGEQLIAAERDLEYAIVRPAIVESSLRFPFPGWVEGGRTAAPLVLMALGGLKHWPVRPDIPLEVVPVDLVAAAILIAGARLMQGEADHVYHLGSQDTNPFELGQLVELLDGEARRSGDAEAPRWLEPSRRLKFISAEEAQRNSRARSRRINRYQNLLGRAENVLGNAGLPGGEALAKVRGSLRALGLQATFREQTMGEYLPFVRDNRYIFESEHIRRAYNSLNEEDQQKLPWDPEHIDWPSYWRNNQIGGILKWVQPEAAREWSFKL